MRIKLSKFVGSFVVIINLVIVYYSWQSVSRIERYIYKPQSNKTVKVSLKHVAKLVTVVIRDFYHLENDVLGTVQSFVKVYPSIQILVLSDGIPYPPINLVHGNSTIPNVKIIDLTPGLSVSYFEQYPLSSINTKYVLFVPDSTRVINRHQLQLMIDKISKHHGHIFVVPFLGFKSLNCYELVHDFMKWTVIYKNNKEFTCDSVSGKHVMLIETDVLRKLPNIYLLPFPHSIYLQTSFLNKTVSPLFFPFHLNLLIKFCFLPPFCIIF